MADDETLSEEEGWAETTWQPAHWDPLHPYNEEACLCQVHMHVLWSDLR